MQITLILLYATLLILLALWVHVKIKVRRMEELACKLPGLKGYPIIGVLHLLAGLKNTTDMLDLLMTMSKKDKVCHAWYCYYLSIMTWDVKVVQTLLTSPDAVEKSYIYKFFAGNIGGVFMAKKDDWNVLRKALNITFNPKKIEEYCKVFNKKGELLMEVLKDNEMKYFDPHPILSRCIIDMITETHFEVETNETKYNTGQVTESMASAVQLTMYRASKPWLYSDYIYKKTSYYKKGRKTKSPTSNFFKKIMSDSLTRKKNSADTENGAKQKELYIDRVAEWVKSRGVEPVPENMRSLLSDIIIAGYDTSSTTLCHLLYNLATHPEVQEKIHEEIDAVLGDDKDGPITKVDFFKMNYLDMAIKETLRMYSPPFVLRELHRELETDYGTFPTGATVWVNIKAVHHDPEHWEKPDEFYPEHFLPEKVAERPRFAYIPFSAGPRNCPGMVYGNYVTRILATMILRKYRIETDVRPENRVMKFVLMVEPLNGFSIKFVPRTS